MAISTHLRRPTAVPHVPSKSRQLHRQNHLSSSNLYCLVTKSINNTNDVTVREHRQWVELYLQVVALT